MGRMAGFAAYDTDYSHGFSHDLVVRLLEFIKPYVRQLAVALVLVLISAGSSLAQPYLISLALDQGISAGNTGRLTTVALIYLVTIVFNSLATWGITRTLSVVGQRVLYDVRTRLFRHLESLSLSYFDKESVGRIISRLTSDVSALNEVLTQGLVSVFADVVTLVGMVAIMVSMSWQLSLLTFAMLPLMVFAGRWFTVASRSAYRRVRLAIAEVNAALAEGIVGMRVVQAFRREAVNSEQFDQVNTAYLGSNRYAIQISSTIMPAIDVFNAAGTALILWFGGRAIIGDTGFGSTPGLTIGVLTAFVLYVQRFFEPIRELTGQYDTLQAATAAGERIFQLLDTQPEVQDKPGAIPLEQIEGHVRFEHVTFGYVPDEPVIRDVSLEARPGERIALVGETGAGKSTIIRLLCRFYDVQSGRITVDGRDLRDVEQHSLRRQVGLVLQDPFLFSGTIRENVAYGRPGATDAEIEEVARAVGLDVAIGRQSLGYHTLVEERGGNLSVGERQLISLARALLADPRILILDEATSSVDTKTEEVVQRGLEVLMRGRTCFVIAHRLATVRTADEIVVLRQGEIVERGTHAELLASGGYYSQLYTLGFPYNEDEELAEDLRMASARAASTSTSR